jgi:hypothetical protein
MPGAPATARATATRCCCPPESCDAHLLERVLYALAPLGRRQLPIAERKLDVLLDGEVADQVERLEDEADLAVPDARALLG